MVPVVHSVAWKHCPPPYTHTHTQPLPVFRVGDPSLCTHISNHPFLTCINPFPASFGMPNHFLHYIVCLACVFIIHCSANMFSLSSFILNITNFLFLLYVSPTPTTKHLNIFPSSSSHTYFLYFPVSLHIHP